MGVGGCPRCKEENTEDYIFNNFYNGIIVKNIVYKELYKKLNKLKFSKAGIESINYNDFKDAIIKFFPEDVKDFQKDSQNNEILKLNESVIFDIYNFIHPSNKNNFSLILLLIFPICSRTLKNKIMKIEELFNLLKKSTLEDINFNRKETVRDGKGNNDSEYLINTWINDEMRINYSVLENNLSFYISTIIVGYSIPIRKFFLENSLNLQYEEMVKIARSYYNSHYLKNFFLNIIKDFSKKMLSQAKKYDVNLNKFYIHYDDFSDFIEKNLFLLDFIETRKAFFEYVKRCGQI